MDHGAARCARRHAAGARPLAWPNGAPCSPLPPVGRQFNGRYSAVSKSRSCPARPRIRRAGELPQASKSRPASGVRTECPPVACSAPGSSSTRGRSSAHWQRGHRVSSARRMPLYIRHLQARGTDATRAARFFVRVSGGHRRNNAGHPPGCCSTRSRCRSAPDRWERSCLRWRRRS